MGCSESKSEDLTRPDDVKPKLSSSVPKPKPASGVFSSDVQDKSQTARTFSEVLVHKNHLPVREVYALDQGLELGRGACGTVSVVQKIATGELFAMKTVSLDTLHGGSIDELRREIDVQKSLDHPNIVRLFEYFEDPHQHLIHIIMELCTGGALVSRMKIHRHGYTEDAARKLVSKMLSAVLYCHQHGVVHRDIKLDNFIYEHEGEDSELKLIDFGFAHECVNGVGEGMWEQIGTPSYMAPELWSDHEKEYNSSVDMWAIGVVTFMLLSGKRPFHHHDRERKAMMIKHDKLSFHSQEWDYVSGEARDFISALMQKEPSRRLSASQALSHPWMSRELATSPRGGINPAVLDSLEAFARAQDIKKVALEVIAFATPPEKLAELRSMFIAMDADRNGTISVDEFKKAMGYSSDLAEQHLEALFRTIDINESGELDYTEFLGAGLSSRHVTKPSMKAAFAILDRNGDGFITKSELRSTLGDDYDDAELDAMITSCGGQGGCITFDNFKSMMLKDMKTTHGNRAWHSASSLKALLTTQNGTAGTI